VSPILGWRDRIWRFWSVRIQLVSAVITGAMFIDPGTLLAGWSLMPDAIRDVLPERLFPAIGVILFILNMLAIFARSVKQPKLEKPDV
jgi:hypothetical protein